MYNDNHFIASDQCCACEYVRDIWVLSDSDDPDSDVLDGGSDCEDGSATDKYYDGCEWYASNTWACGEYDDDDFTAATECCACANPEGDSGRTCVDGEGTNELGYGCSWYENEGGVRCIYNDMFMTEDFDPSVECCICGGGY